MHQEYKQWNDQLMKALNSPNIQRSLEKGVKTQKEKDRRNLDGKNEWMKFCELNNIFVRYQNVSIYNLSIPDDERGSYLEKAKFLLSNPSSLLLIGKAGRGKTHFMFSLIRAMFDAKMLHIGDIRYFDNIELDRRMQEEVRTFKTAKDFIESISSVPILVIDDFGTDTGSRRNERDFYEIFNKRFGRNLITILSTNLPESEIKEIYGERISSRLKDCIVIDFNGPDLRGKRI